MKIKKFIFLTIFCLTATSILFITNSQSKNQVEQRKFKVYMVLWRGITEAEKGFMEYFKFHNIEVDFVIQDCKEDKAQLPKVIEEIKRLKPDLIYAFGTTVAANICGTIQDYIPKELGYYVFKQHILDKLDNSENKKKVLFKYYKFNSTKQTYSIDENLSKEAKRNIFEILYSIGYNPKRYITDIPVVFNIVADPVGADLVLSLETSGRNLTGTSHLVPFPIQMKAMQSVHSFNRLGVIFNPEEKNSILAIKALEEICNKMNYEFIKAPIPIDVNKKPIEKEIPNTIRILVGKKPQLIYLPSDSFIISHCEVIMKEINKYKIPTFSATETPIIKAGALMGLVSHYYNVGKFAAYKAIQILIQKKLPKDIPIETLKRFSFLINMKSAKELNTYPPISIFKFAEVITD